MRRSAVWLSCLLCLGPVVAGAAAPGDDGWSGTYGMTWVPGAAAAAGVEQPPSKVVIAKAPDADPARRAGQDGVDRMRWTLAESGSKAGDGAELRRFREREYAEWGWADIHRTGGMDCLDGGRMFVCRTSPDTTVAFGPEGPRRETLFARTGVFGIALHAGAFELKKLDNQHE